MKLDIWMIERWQVKQIQWSSCRKVYTIQPGWISLLHFKTYKNKSNAGPVKMLDAIVTNNI